MRNFVVVTSLWLGLLAAPLGFCATSHETEEPIIYVTLARWENRTFSPRLFYATRVQSEEAELKGSPEQSYAYETPPLVVSRVVEDNQLSSSNLLSKKSKQKSSDSATPRPKGDSGSDGGRGVEEDINDEDDRGGAEIASDSITFRSELRNRTVSNRGEITVLDMLKLNEDKGALNLELGADDKDPIVFKDVGINRRGSPVKKGLQQRNDLEYIFSCNWNGRTPTGVKVPRSASLPSAYGSVEHIDTLKLSLEVARGYALNAENFVFSPLSIFGVLTLLLRGSSGSTFDELAEILWNTEDDADLSINSSVKEFRLHQTFAHLLYVLNNCSHPGVVLETANELFTDSSFPVVESFKGDVRQLYGASSRSFDFKLGGSEFQDLANKWVREKTKGKIHSIIDGPPSPLTTLALMNAVYFQGSWEVPFAPQITRDSVFHIDYNLTVPVKLMTNVMNASYVETDNYRMVRLPYRDEETAIYFVLPKRSGINGLLELERTLSSADLESKLDSMAVSPPQMVTVKIPRMRLESDGNLKEILRRLGVSSIFDAHVANLSRISPTPGLHVSSLLHKAIIDINEKGTEAAAVSVATGDRYIDSVPIPFIVNRPFLFFIHNQFVNSILFWGRVIYPQPLVN